MATIPSEIRQIQKLDCDSVVFAHFRGRKFDGACFLAFLALECLNKLLSANDQGVKLPNEISPSISDKSSCWLGRSFENEISFLSQKKLGRPKMKLKMNPKSAQTAMNRIAKPKRAPYRACDSAQSGLSEKNYKETFREENNEPSRYLKKIKKSENGAFVILFSSFLCFLVFSHLLFKFFFQ